MHTKKMIKINKKLCTTICNLSSTSLDEWIPVLTFISYLKFVDKSQIYICGNGTTNFVEMLKFKIALFAEMSCTPLYMYHTEVFVNKSKCVKMKLSSLKQQIISNKSWNNTKHHINFRRVKSIRLKLRFNSKIVLI